MDRAVPNRLSRICVEGRESPRPKAAENSQGGEGGYQSVSNLRQPSTGLSRRSLNESPPSYFYMSAPSLLTRYAGRRQRAAITMTCAAEKPNVTSICRL